MNGPFHNEPFHIDDRDQPFQVPVVTPTKRSQEVVDQEFCDIANAAWASWSDADKARIRVLTSIMED